MRFSKLLEVAEVVPLQRKGDAEVAAVVSDSRRCGTGACFVAVRGWNEDGHKYLPQALTAGSAAVVCEDPSAVPEGVACAVVADAREALGRLAQAIQDWPSRKLVNIGVTGTKGKSTVTYLIRAVLSRAGHNPGLLGTISYETGSRVLPAGNTTPGPAELAELSAEMVRAGKTHLVMEVSSHALDQRRTAGVGFTVGVFTNLTGDHLDYHKTMEQYGRAKRLLFEQLPPQGAAVINRDDPAGPQMAEGTRAKVIWYGLSTAADVWARIERIDACGTRFALVQGRREHPVFTPLIGRHNVLNCLAAAGACAGLGIDLPVIAAGLETVARVPGRTERVDIAAPYQVFVDYAHTDDAMEKALSAVRPLTRKDLIVVFGCGGDRDRTKRPRMGRVAARLADKVVVTSDNPRSEKPEAIIEEIVAGLDENGRRKTTVEPDRRSAIESAIASASEGDVVVIAGKGHETYQIIGDRRVHFDDAEVAAECMRRREGRS
jgi:UDP-N-acetylmuramoyl-L-alanyl-D-glutamate--2,6-diaminopimelate ligase